MLGPLKDTFTPWSELREAVNVPSAGVRVNRCPLPTQSPAWLSMNSRVVGWA